MISAGSESGQPAPAAVSPSLLGRLRGGPPAYEFKFVVDEQTAQQIEDSLRPQMQVDPHSEPELDGAYRVTTFYFDTPDLDVLRGIGRHKLRKYRLRKYGASPTLFVERKTKRGRRVRKRRSSVESQLVPRALSAQAPIDDPAGWFGRQLARFRLTPMCRVQYDRRAFFGSTPDGPIRLTFDRRLRSWPVDGWSLEVQPTEVEVLTDRVICEFKFRGAMPGVFKAIMQQFQLAPAGFSKYRQSMWLLQPSLRESHQVDGNQTGPNEGPANA